MGSPSEIKSALQVAQDDARSPFQNGQDESTVPNKESCVTRWQLVRNLVAGGLGTGMLSLPWAMAGSSVLPGVAAIFFVIALNLWTIMILVEGAERYQAFDLGNLLGKLPGRLGVCMQSLTNICVFLCMIGVLISYFITIRDATRTLPLIQGTFLDGNFQMVTLTGCVILPLCFLDQRYLSFTSLAAVLVNCYLFAVLCHTLGSRYFEDSLPSGSCYMGFASGGVTMVSTMAQCVVIQMCILPMYKELEDRSPTKFLWVITVAFAILAGLFALFAVVGYLSFGPTVEDNILKNLPQNLTSNICNTGMVIVIAAVYPLMVIPMVAPIQNLDLQWFMKSRDGDVDKATRNRTMFVRAFIVFLVFLSWLGGWLVKELGTVIVVDGAASVAIFPSLCPGLIGLYLLKRESMMWKFSMYSLIVIGMIMTAVGLFYLDNNYKELETKCLW